ncbi:hypothetical protein TTHERM_000759018 (macronuclear) [Tetrahymena thermophila SB210]|uniref:Uncharacterized protein n=1 Tax=Tetrahymena thermophila (strain SB210) TaxID=312017 RepID=W7X4C2_TETTS|nr:hypothetical protein TTHERM_000759018 [Tetrahymena thermophila SB210]EWS74160.1 hypothetical protein TTHERM_000759018 [Tetrahymena thermophila SB210]|eukprot:XP_012653300.1 hypothetical protein TTHERM_000759018 [Tetrahymena thermophila SB210]
MMKVHKQKTLRNQINKNCNSRILILSSLNIQRTRLNRVLIIVIQIYKFRSSSQINRQMTILQIKLMIVKFKNARKKKRARVSKILTIYQVLKRIFQTIKP